MFSIRRGQKCFAESDAGLKMMGNGLLSHLLPGDEDAEGLVGIGPRVSITESEQAFIGFASQSRVLPQLVGMYLVQQGQRRIAWTASNLVGPGYVERETKINECSMKLAGYGKTRCIHKIPLKSHRMPLLPQYLRMIKMAVQQGRSERRGEAYASVR
jgi:hypothetical protein